MAVSNLTGSHNKSPESALAVASAGPGRGREAIADPILMQIRTKVEQMYDAGTAERLMVAFERGFGRTGRPGSRRA